MDKNKVHRFIILAITIAALGLVADSILEKWEYWVIPILIGGIIGLWVLHISQVIPEKGREAFYVAFGMFCVFFHGVHNTSFFDVAFVATLIISLVSLLDSLFVLNLVFIECVIFMILQIVMLFFNDVTVDSIDIARIILQFFALVVIFEIARMSIIYRLEYRKRISEIEELMDANNSDMEDFLSNISHELRTPINVVNGMSMLLLKKEKEEELIAIQNAGYRLSDQIESIQDFTEVKRSSVSLEKENYMITTLANEVAADFRRFNDRSDIELVIDLDPLIPRVMNGDVKKIKKIIRHLLSNSLKFTRRGGVYIRIYETERKYGINLCIEVTDTGIGMERRSLALAGAGMYQANKKRNRSTGGIGLGLSIVYGLVHRMGGFIKIESQKGRGTTVRVTIPQEVVEKEPCITINDLKGDIIFHVNPNGYKVPVVRDFYRDMATNMAYGLKTSLYSADTIKEVENLLEKLNVKYIFMGEKEYSENTEFFEELTDKGITVAISARADFKTKPGSKAVIMPKPLYGYPVSRILNGEKAVDADNSYENSGKLFYGNSRALIVDDEPMNLVVAKGMFKDYFAQTDTALSGAEAIKKYESVGYDVVFMDHMMPEMDGVEAMKLLKDSAKKSGKNVAVIALTANAMSGARDMFFKEGFDGFMAKPIEISEFERIMKRVLPQKQTSYEGGERS
ncbi:MAG: response regulator [Lachnospiraceae bacterium]|nr:response regulator [Lachnospiraceae bacterium]